ncbi:hypothetical protein GGG17_05170 [Arsenicicoccus sp. MKL-02]|uniref:Uncharacterized protein n=1 Tax=Arsenicicoccus cauae TaxID=2663847 RepID=A0A6I3IRR2_9MICO|nr:hypothetical protein [Arsenicicoccus cauae]MTB71369.1 hypothetical protein [Arsenicicoccus cauae]
MRQKSWLGPVIALLLAGVAMIADVTGALPALSPARRFAREHGEAGWLCALVLAACSIVLFRQRREDDRLKAAVDETRLRQVRADIALLDDAIGGLSERSGPRRALHALDGDEERFSSTLFGDRLRALQDRLPQVWMRVYDDELREAVTELISALDGYWVTLEPELERVGHPVDALYDMRVVPSGTVPGEHSKESDSIRRRRFKQLREQRWYFLGALAEVERRLYDLRTEAGLIDSKL